MKKDEEHKEVVQAASLAEWLARPKLKPEAILKVGSAARESLSLDDLDEAVRLVHDQPKLLSRAADIVRAASKVKPKLRSNLFDFGVRVLEKAAPDSVASFVDNSAPVRTALHELCEWAKPRILGSDPDKRKMAESALAIGLILLKGRAQNLPTRTILDLVGDACGVARVTGNEVHQMDRSVDALLSRSNPRQIAQFARIWRLQEAEVFAAQDQSRLDGRLLATARSETEALGSLLHEEKARSVALSTDLAKAEQVCLDLRKQMQSQAQKSAHEYEDLKARYRKLLAEKVKVLASDARDGLEMEPPKPDFSTSFLTDLLQTIDGELQWLNAPTA